jgi:hypothetical protein
MDSMTPEAVMWSRQHFEMLADLDVWGVPRSGLMFQKQRWYEPTGEVSKLVLIARMPWIEGMPITEEGLREYQQEDYETIKANFEAAGIVVEDRSDEQTL